MIKVIKTYENINIEKLVPIKGNSGNTYFKTLAGCKHCIKSQGWLDTDIILAYKCESGYTLENLKP